MGSKYTSPSLVGFNSSPPSDDGTQVDSNKVEWQKHIDKIGTPLKDQVAAMDVAIAAYTDLAPTAKSSTYSVLTTDHLKTIECNGTFTVTLVATATAGAGFTSTVKNVGTGVITVEGAGSELIDGVASLTLAENDSVTVQVDAAISAYIKLDHYDASESTDVTPISLGGTGSATAATARTALGLDTMSEQAASSVAITGGTITGGTITGITDLAVSDGGTGAGTFTDAGVLIGNATGAVQATTAGTSGQVLTSNGAGVDPTFQANSVGGLLTKIIDIGDWNMDTDNFVTVAHGLTLADIRQISATIRDDTGVGTHDLFSDNGAGTGNHRIGADATNITLIRPVSGYFDNTSFDSTSYNRGWIIIQYTA